MPRVVLFSGGGDYTDPWHPFAETSAIVAGLLRDEGLDVTVVDRVDALEPTLPADLMVVNAGSGLEPHPLDARLAHILTGARGLIALHVAAALLPDHPEWEDLLGGRWVRGVTMHPERGPLRLRAVGDDPLTAALASIQTIDEAYCRLRVKEESRVLYAHEHDGAQHPVVWTAEQQGRRVAYSALGHDAEAYDSAEVRESVRRLARWVLTPGS